MNTVYICLGWLLIAIGVIGCVMPILPGPLIAYVALFTAKACGDHSVPSFSVLLVAALVTGIVTLLDYIVPALGAKKFHCSRLGIIGSAVGTLVGLFFLPFGVVVGPFFGALIGESASGKNLGQASFGALGAFLGFMFGVVIKLMCCGYIAYCFYCAIK